MRNTLLILAILLFLPVLDMEARGGGRAGGRGVGGAYRGGGVGRVGGYGRGVVRPIQRTPALSRAALYSAGVAGAAYGAGAGGGDVYIENPNQTQGQQGQY